jgi:hypothetical protein
MIKNLNLQFSQISQNKRIFANINRSTLIIKL